MAELINPAPLIHAARRDVPARQATCGGVRRDALDAWEVYDLVRCIKDPEHPNTLEQLRVVTPEHIAVDDEAGTVALRFTPTVPHCSMTTLIGICILVKLQRCLPPRFKLAVAVSPGSHEQEAAVNKQLADKERVAAALENSALMQAVVTCLKDVS